MRITMSLSANTAQMYCDKCGRQFSGTASDGLQNTHICPRCMYQQSDEQKLKNRKADLKRQRDRKKFLEETKIRMAKFRMTTTRGTMTLFQLKELEHKIETTAGILEGLING